MGIEKILNIAVLSAYVIVLFVGGIAMSFLMIEKRKARHSLRDSILKKIANSIQLTALDLVLMAKGVGLQRPSVSRTINQLLHDTHDPHQFEQLKILSAQL